MGGAVAIVAKNSGLEAEILLSNRSPKKAEELAEKLGACAKVSTNKEIAQTCDMIFLGVKPYFMEDMLAELKEDLKARAAGAQAAQSADSAEAGARSASASARPCAPAGANFVLVSMAAGLSTEDIQRMAGGDYPVIRMMPNTPIVTGSGVIQYCGKDIQSEADYEFFKNLMKPAGLVDELEERLIDAASAVSGCGPAFCYMFIEALADGGVAVGLPRDKAMKYAAKMVEGAGKMVLESGDHPGKLKDAVCSPGGTTIQGVRTLEERGFRGAAMDAVIADYEKTVGIK